MASPAICTENPATVTVARAQRIDQLSDPMFLGSQLGPVAGVTEEPMGTAGFSGSGHTRLNVTLQSGGETRLVLKRTRLAADWTAYRTGDVLGREAMLLATPQLAGVWRAFRSPYLAWATEPGAVGLLMHDLAPRLFPDVREPIAIDAEDAVLDALARMHAMFWDSPALDLPWLGREAHLMACVGPIVIGDDPMPPLPEALGKRVAEGWREAFRVLPARAADRLRDFASGRELPGGDLPRTLVHGDAKVANFAILPDGAVAAFDWAVVSRAPASVDLGWYLAVNATRLARGKEQVIARYRERLERWLANPIEAATWSRLVEAAALDGALMLLWSKALAVRDGRAGAREEWDWWVERLPV